MLRKSIILSCALLTSVRGRIINSNDNKNVVEALQNHDGPYVFELRRQQSPLDQIYEHRHHLKDFVSEHVKRLLRDDPKPPRDNDSIALYRFLDDQFYGEIVIGHPGQKFNVAFDTTWSLSWIMSSRCNYVQDRGCMTHNLYNHDKSSEYKKDGAPFEMNTGNFNLSGFYSYDNISIAHSNVTDYRFIEMVKVPDEFALYKSDGILGLGLKVDDYDPFFYTLYKQKKIKNPIFSIWLNRDPQSKKGGNVILGFIEQRHIHMTNISGQMVRDNFTTIQVDNLPYWQFNMDKAYVNKTVGKGSEITSLCEKDCKTIVDSSSVNIVGSITAVEAIHDIIQAKQVENNKFVVPCANLKKLPKIYFVLGGNNFILGGTDYIVKVTNVTATVCFSTFQAAETTQEQGRWILGGAFLSAYYSVYDIEQKTIGFVKSA